MCKTPFAATDRAPSRHRGHGSLAASWTRPRDRRGHAAEAVVLAALGALSPRPCSQAGDRAARRSATVGLAALVAAVVGVVGGASGHRGVPAARPGGRPRGRRRGRRSTAWAGLSTAWSIAGDRSWEWLGRGLVYLSFLALGLLAGALVAGRHAASRRCWPSCSARRSAGRCSASRSPPSSRTATGSRGCASPSATGTPSRSSPTARSRSGCGSRADPRVPAQRRRSAALGYAAVLALLLTQSRSGVIAGRSRPRPLARALGPATRRRSACCALRRPRASPSAGWAFTRPALVEVEALRADRVDDGRDLRGPRGDRRRSVAVAGVWLVPVRRLVSERRRAVVHGPRGRRGRRRARRGWPGSSPRSATRSPGRRPRSAAESARTTPAGSPTSARTTGSPGGTRRSRSPRTDPSAGRAPGRSRSRAGRSGTTGRRAASRTACRSSSSPTSASSASASGSSSRPPRSSGSAAGSASSQATERPRRGRARLPRPRLRRALARRLRPRLPRRDRDRRSSRSARCSRRGVRRDPLCVPACRAWSRSSPSA